jgi:uncharacterized membrane protein
MEEGRRARPVTAMGSTKQQVPAGGTDAPDTTGAGRARLDAVDRLRGLVMVLMALDHVRGYFTNPFPDPTDLDHTSAALFLTRWISHLCAPTFLFLAGTGAYLAARRGKTRPELAWFLLTRGLWIVLLGQTLVRFAWSFSLEVHNYNADVLWAIGWSMVALAGLVFLPTWVVTAFGLVLILGHNLLDPVRAADFGPFSDLWEILHRKEMHRAGPLEFFGGALKFDTQYPLIPWVGVMAAGYGFGALLLRDAAVRRKWLLGLAAGLCLGFLLLRAANLYGDPDPWSRQRDGTFTVLSFLNCHKYPPSLLYLLMTLGPALLLLAFFERAPQLPGRPLLVFGRVPMFFYLIHIPLIHALASGAALVYYGPALLDAEQLPGDYGYRLPVVYGIWLGVVLALYPVCRWFAGVKRRRRDAWLSYF